MEPPYSKKVRIRLKSIDAIRTSLVPRLDDGSPIPALYSLPVGFMTEALEYEAHFTFLFGGVTLSVDKSAAEIIPNGEPPVGAGSGATNGSESPPMRQSGAA